MPEIAVLAFFDQGEGSLGTEYVEAEWGLYRFASILQTTLGISTEFEHSFQGANQFLLELGLDELSISVRRTDDGYVVKNCSYTDPADLSKSISYNIMEDLDDHIRFSMQQRVRFWDGEEERRSLAKGSEPELL